MEFLRDTWKIMGLHICVSLLLFGKSKIFIYAPVYKYGGRFIGSLDEEVPVGCETGGCSCYNKCTVF
ncbi:hypothetical protein XELAEV_18004624mg [Xenopus laevis]|uniref:Uncharacterized protein n=1 Tax=Xenopus laevis TaxID=8355 RepID=A0A974BPJ7_XENLA|nr:hypothetical protein XELAEV_18004624mg [Xenopus laevis]